MTMSATTIPRMRLLLQLLALLGLTAVRHAESFIAQKPSLMGGARRSEVNNDGHRSVVVQRMTTPPASKSTQSHASIPATGDKNSEADEGGKSNDDNTDTELKLEDLFEATKTASIPCGAETANGAHDAFRFEWGRWVDDDAMESLQEVMDCVRLASGAYDELTANTGDDDDDSSPPPGRYRLDGGEYWDIILHVLPPDEEWNGRWPTGSWAVVKALTGVSEISMLRGPNRDGFYTKATKKSLRGGGDGTLGGGGDSFGGEDCVKYVGGALRSYSGKSGRTTLLEAVVRPPVGTKQMDGDGQDSSEIQILDDPNRFLTMALPVVDDAISEEADGHSDGDQADGEAGVPGEDGAAQASNLGAKMGLTFDKVGGLDDQLNAIVRRVLASRANPEAARRLGVSHVRGILLSGPPGCGKTLLARELSRMLGAREPQIVNGPEILDKFVGEAEKNIRALFAPAEVEYAQVGDASALHVIILDEMDAIARKRGTVTGDSTGVRDSVVNQLLAKMDGVKEANNVLVVGLTNRPELLDPALLRPGRLEVQLRVELPDVAGRRDILRIHTRRMKEAGGLSLDAMQQLENLTDGGIPAMTEHFTGAELAGLVRSAASFALARTVESSNGDGTAIDADADAGTEASDASDGMVSVADLEQALMEVRPALGKQDEVLVRRFPHGISRYSAEMQRTMQSLKQLTCTSSNALPIDDTKSRIESMLLVGEGSGEGCGVTALACWAASEASAKGEADYVRLVTSLDLAADAGDEQARATALIDRFTEASQMPTSMLVIDDVDQICAGDNPSGMSSVMIATLRALLRSPPATTTSARAGGHSKGSGGNRPRRLQILATVSSSSSLASFNAVFDEVVTVPRVTDVASLTRLLTDGCASSGLVIDEPESMAQLTIDRLGSVGSKTALKWAERAVSMSKFNSEGVAAGQQTARSERDTTQLACLKQLLPTHRSKC